MVIVQRLVAVGPVPQLLFQWPLDTRLDTSNYQHDVQILLSHGLKEAIEAATSGLADYRTQLACRRILLVAPSAQGDPISLGRGDYTIAFTSVTAAKAFADAFMSRSADVRTSFQRLIDQPAMAPLADQLFEQLVYHHLGDGGRGSELPFRVRPDLDRRVEDVDYSAPIATPQGNTDTEPTDSGQSLSLGHAGPFTTHRFELKGFSAFVITPGAFRLLQITTGLSHSVKVGVIFATLESLSRGDFGVNDKDRILYCVVGPVLTQVRSWCDELRAHLHRLCSDEAYFAAACESDTLLTEGSHLRWLGRLEVAAVCPTVDGIFYEEVEPAVASH